MNKKWFALSIDQVEEKLRTNAAAGLSRKAARSRCNKANGSIYIAERKSVWRMLAEIVSDFNFAILLIIAVASFFFEEYGVGAVIISLLGMNTLFSLFIYHRSVRSRESADRFFKPVAKVIREGKLYCVDYDDVVPGDVLLLEKGDFIGCDARLTSSNSLKVRMKIDKERVCELEKNAISPVNQNEKYAYNMTNMVHANSVVVSGSARAIVTGVGRYTYFSALTGGIERSEDQRIPEALQGAKKFFSGISLLILIAILPICVIGLLMSQLRSGTVYLSEAFLLLVALAYSLVGQRACTVFQYFYVLFLRRSILNESPCAIRSMSALKELSDIDYLFLLDGCLLSDGAFRYVDTISDDDKNDYLADMVYMYRNASSKALSSGLAASERYGSGIDGFLSEQKVDVEKIRIKYASSIYTTDVVKGEKLESVVFSDGGEKKVLRIYRTPGGILNCDSAIINDQKSSLSRDKIHELENRCVEKMLAGDRILMFTVSSADSETFVGALVFKEVVDTNALKSIQAIQNSGFAKVIAFAENYTEKQISQIPHGVYRAPCVNAEDFLRKNLPVTYQVGSFPTYCGMSEEHIESLVEYVHAQGKNVAVVGASDFALGAITKADMFITCSPIAPSLSGYLDQEMISLETTDSTSSCNQSIKENASILASRPDDNSGGLKDILRAFRFSMIADQNLSGYFRFLVAVFALRGLFSVLPLLLGDITVDARHVMFFTVFLDLPMMMFFATNFKIRFNNSGINTFCVDLKEYIIKERKLLAAMLTSTVVALLLPYIPDAFGAAYMYKTEYQFAALLWLQLTIVYYLVFGDLKNIGRFLKSRALLIAFSVSVVAIAIIFMIRPVGAAFGIQKNPILYSALGFAPCISFWISIFISNKVKSKKNVNKL